MNFHLLRVLKICINDKIQPSFSVDKFSRRIYFSKIFIPPQMISPFPRDMHILFFSPNEHVCKQTANYLHTGPKRSNVISKQCAACVYPSFDVHYILAVILLQKLNGENKMQNKITSILLLLLHNKINIFMYIVSDWFALK